MNKVKCWKYVQCLPTNLKSDSNDARLRTEKEVLSPQNATIPGYVTNIYIVSDTQLVSLVTYITYPTSPGIDCKREKPVYVWSKGQTNHPSRGRISIKLRSKMIETCFREFQMLTYDNFAYPSMYYFRSYRSRKIKACGTFGKIQSALFQF